MLHGGHVHPPMQKSIHVIWVQIKKKKGCSMHPCTSNYYLVFQVSLPVSFSDAFILTLLLETISLKN